ncbi:NAD(P)H-dependent glycerol-3-phosphate dehydrogenase [Nostocoides australiense]|uniref:Glycerol-3-phosphate dehydrogenase [NAD(P)+] n=1 Tax=Nostocoides australiense Ben110 TaxID=1193182 RepID=W6K4M1_9MICO|nr:NAD(P)H-dependent glycerol-3-phosphate dehydrogenase [Tetrasphaera australiensis]MCA0293611.1 NAD(P)H-dependent glycerol-3-phosphate dehydrogenase [Actinomycetota bacterium]MCB1301536.1 NAD(P)H-dependent glycerol-3-phosphate dehydrogenase [Tetrasphaera sp.]CCH75254.1 Glycerol-3-phosphate dehydrogenase (NAD(P)+) [Tetrasphaera australiensis Ben110]HPF82050.1 NAD(P)H-dependent glycerol-3-phosphate dehydrogenase [Tetrasphaera australiensis]HRW00957.1 NAD(P)H-dependent glycerol-3-phosphate dehyd
MRRPNVTVLGGGSWGSAIASIAARNAPTLLWARDEATVADINERHVNSRYLDDLPLNPALRATNDLEHAIATADVLVLGVPSQACRGVLTEAAEHLRPWVPIVSLVKGLEQGSRLRITEVVRETLPGHPVGVLNGPNIAREIAAGYAAAATLAMPDQQQAESLQNLLRSTMFRVYTSTDVVGVEVAGALKNIFAIATGFGDGLEAGDNTRAMVITRSLRELSRLGVAMGGHEQTFSGLAGMGDLIATCTSPHSRNRRVGIRLAQGKTLPEIEAELKQVAEGVKSAPVVMELSREHGVEMPIAREVDAVLNHGQTAVRAYRGLLREAPEHEFHGDAW